MVARGFTLVEVLVSLVLLSVGILAVAAGGSWATAVLYDGERAERAALEASNVLDSLLQQRTPAAGSDRVGALELSWSVQDAGGALSLELRVEEPGREPTRYVVLTGPPLPLVRAEGDTAPPGAQ